MLIIIILYHQGKYNQKIMSIINKCNKNILDWNNNLMIYIEKDDKLLIKCRISEMIHQLLLKKLLFLSYFYWLELLSEVESKNINNIKKNSNN